MKAPIIYSLWIFYHRPEALAAADKIIRRHRGKSFGGGTNLMTGECDESYEFRSLASAVKARDALKVAGWQGKLRGIKVRLYDNGKIVRYVAPAKR